MTKAITFVLLFRSSTVVAYKTEFYDSAAWDDSAPSCPAAKKVCCRGYKQVGANCVGKSLCITIQSIFVIRVLIWYCGKAVRLEFSSRCCFHSDLMPITYRVNASCNECIRRKEPAIMYLHKCIQLYCIKAKQHHPFDGQK